MAKFWDYLMKMLARANPQHLVSLLLPGAQFEGELVTELQNRTIEADLLYNVIWNRKKAVLHVEFQRRGDSNMGKRLWEYNVLTTYLTGLPVCSFALYLKKGGKVIESPYEQVLPDSEVVHLFYFRNIKLWELPAETIKQPGLEGMFPLLPLFKGGKRREVVEEMIAELDAAGKKDLLPLGYAFAALVFDKEGEQEWLRKRFHMLRDIFEESWAYKEMVQKGHADGLEQGLEKGLEKGRQEGKLEAQRETLLDIIQERFPAMVRLAKKQVDAIEDPTILRHIAVKMSTVQTSEEAEQYLLTIVGDEKKN